MLRGEHRPVRAQHPFMLKALRMSILARERKWNDTHPRRKSNNSNHPSRQMVLLQLAITRSNPGEQSGRYLWHNWRVIKCIVTDLRPSTLGELYSGHTQRHIYLQCQQNDARNKNGQSGISPWKSVKSKEIDILLKMLGWWSSNDHSYVLKYILESEEMRRV